MKKYNIESCKYSLILLILCLLFAFLVWKAFKYLPNMDVDNDLYTQEIEYYIPNVTEKKEHLEESDENEINETTVKEEDNLEESTKTNNEDVKPYSLVEEKDLEIKTVSDLTTVEKNVELIKKYKENNDWKNVLILYQKMISESNDSKVKAGYYEDIAYIYAYLKKYGSALAAAQAAYNLDPTSTREMLLARLYYKTGDTDKASYRVENVLKREFDINDR